LSFSGFVLILLVWWLAISLLNQRGLLEKHNIGAVGPVLMLRTTRGLGLLERLSRARRFWQRFADLGVFAMAGAMVAMFLLLIALDLMMVSQLEKGSMPPPSRLNAPRNVFLIPGVNEFIPLVWGVIGLAVTLVVHEFAHAILCRVEGIRVKSMGLLLAIIPIGGFAEPDEEELLGKKEKQESNAVVTRKERMRVLSAGVMANFVVGITALSLFFLGLNGITAVGNVMVTNVLPGSPADNAGLEEGVLILEVDGQPISGAHDLLNKISKNKRGDIHLLIWDKGRRNITLPISNDSTTKPTGVEVMAVLPSSPAWKLLEKGDIITAINGTPINNLQDYLKKLEHLQKGETTLTVTRDNRTLNITLPVNPPPRKGGLEIMGIVENSSARRAGLEKGMIITRMDNTNITGLGDFIGFMEATHPGQTVTVETQDKNGSRNTYQLNLTANPRDPTLGFLGVEYNPQEASRTLGVWVAPPLVSEPLGLKLGEFRAAEYLTALKKIPSMLNSPRGWAILLGLPFTGISGEGFTGFTNTLTHFYETRTGGIWLFWALNALLWIGWINFYAGLFNCLPMLPLDGGHAFRDITSSIFQGILQPQKLEKTVSILVNLFTLLVIASFLFMLLAPDLAQRL